MPLLYWPDCVLVPASLLAQGGGARPTVQSVDGCSAAYVSPGGPHHRAESITRAHLAKTILRFQCLEQPKTGRETPLHAPQSRAAGFGGDAGTVALEQLPRLLLWRSWTGRSEPVGSPPDEDSSASRIRAKPKAARSPNGPLLEKREKWRTPSISWQRSKAARVILFALMWPTRLHALQSRAARLGGVAGTVALEQLPRLLLWRSWTGRSQPVGSPPDEDSSASRIEAKPKAARSSNGPLLERREKWRTPRRSRVQTLATRRRATQVYSAASEPTRLSNQRHHP